MVNYKIAGVEESDRDYRDYPYVSIYSPEQLPRSVDLRDKVDLIRIEDQLSIGSCVGNGVTSTMEQFTDVELSRLFLYVGTKAETGRLGKEGLHTRTAYEFARKTGVCTEDQWPYDISMDDIVPPEEIYKEAKYKIDRYEAVVASKSPLDKDFRIHQIKSALTEGFLVGFAMPVRKSLFDFTGPWQEHSYDTRTDIVGGHYMYIVGYDDAFRKFIIANSWGENWGDNGFGGLPYDIVNQSFFEAYIVRTVNGVGFKEPRGAKIEFINKRLIKARYTPSQEEIGNKVKIWVGGKDLQGNIFMKQPVEVKDYFLGNRTDFSGQTDNWVPLGDSMPEPVVVDYEIKEDNPMRLISWRDLTVAKGARLYVAIGTDTVFNAEIWDLGVVPDYI